VTLRTEAWLRERRVPYVRVRGSVAERVAAVAEVLGRVRKWTPAAW
jgi:hypothetical protein